MMETARIRSAGYPIRYDYNDFVDRFRYLAHGIPPAHKTNCRGAAEKICSNVLPNDSDYQFGNTKIFLKTFHDDLLEKERTKILSRYILLIQKNIRMWIQRRRYLQLRKATITIQKHFRARGYRQKYLIIKRGYYRLQAVIRSRQCSYEFQKIRNSIVKLQARCRGYLIRMCSKSAKDKERLKKTIMENESGKIDNKDVDAYVDDIFENVFRNESSSPISMETVRNVSIKILNIHSKKQYYTINKLRASYFFLIVHLRLNRN